MPPVTTDARPFEPGTTGWTADDLDDPRIEACWVRGRYEIVEGVLTKMPPAYFVGGESLFKLMKVVDTHLSAVGRPAAFSTEVEIIIDRSRVLRADAALLTPADEARQVEAVIAAGRKDPDRTRLLIPPTLVIESVSPGHESHDRQTKKRWYAEFGVPNYWVLDAFGRTLECYGLEGGAYGLGAKGEESETLQVTALGGLAIPLAKLWKVPPRS